jgi:hypothetical protein
MTSIDFWRGVYATEAPPAPGAHSIAAGAAPSPRQDPRSTGPREPMENR